MYKSRYVYIYLLDFVKSLNDKILVFNDTIVPKIYENIRMKVSRREGDSERVVEFMKQLKSHQVVESIILRPR